MKIERLARIKREIEDGSYETRERIEGAADRLLGCVKGGQGRSDADVLDYAWAMWWGAVLGMLVGGLLLVLDWAGLSTLPWL